MTTQHKHIHRQIDRRLNVLWGTPWHIHLEPIRTPTSTTTKKKKKKLRYLFFLLFLFIYFFNVDESLVRYLLLLDSLILRERKRERSSEWNRYRIRRKTSTTKITTTNETQQTVISLREASNKKTTTTIRLKERLITKSQDYSIYRKRMSSVYYDNDSSMNLNRDLKKRKKVFPSIIFYYCFFFKSVNISS